MAERDHDDDDRLGGRSGPRRDPGPGPIRRYRDEDRGEDPAGHFRRADLEVARRLAGADTGSLRAQPDHRGRGPRGYRRSDERILEDVHARLTDDPHVDASDVEVTVKDGEVTLSGTVDDRRARRRAEDIAEGVSGVTHVQNNTRVRQGREGPPIYEGATSSSALGGLDAGMGSSGVSGLSGSPAGSGAMGTTGGRGAAAPGVTSTTGAGYSEMTGTGRTGGPTPGSDEGAG